MQLIWSPEAEQDLDELDAYIAERNPAAADNIVERIDALAAALRIFPERGRSGRVAGTRELVIPDLPWLLIYEITGNEIHILRVLHGARDWPPP
ncbi:type II toxin-antitoxin system RelE/ParE family toxin [Ferrovibrio sp.]|uniref:type II toxin-antitoxin system RelE/ParE family toxin n=1 Tax=Ferrovibrio sp. TaxID=1917215 RepID=UPI0025C17521|nr:type II toxin-antitoxin system RelE/ParE family toxin [Ferrovibrio sp.]MBX3455842.1 type II toxin-antitoxin system RelE/ParE family toxin [Ferrovibrio sp.]